MSLPAEPRPFSTDCSPPPCFYWKSCRRYAGVEQQGKSVCRPCAERLKGIPYPLRLPTRAPLYHSGWELARDLDMLEEGHSMSGSNHARPPADDSA